MANHAIRGKQSWTTSWDSEYWSKLVGRPLCDMTHMYYSVKQVMDTSRYFFTNTAMILEAQIFFSRLLSKSHEQIHYDGFPVEYWLENWLPVKAVHSTNWIWTTFVATKSQFCSTWSYGKQISKVYNSPLCELQIYIVQKFPEFAAHSFARRHQKIIWLKRWGHQSIIIQLIKIQLNMTPFNITE